MNLLAFLGAVSLSVLTFEILSALPGGLNQHRLKGISPGTERSIPTRRSTWHALLVVLWPQRFDPDQARNQADVVGMLRRAGYPYSTPGEFYAASVRTFSIYLLLGGLLAGTLFSLGNGLAIPVGVGAVFIFLGLRRPYVHLKMLAKKRAEGLQRNMLTGLAVLNALMSSGVGVQEALRRTSVIGGPFCNLLGLLTARMSVDPYHKAMETTRAHLPDPEDVEANLFLRDIDDFFANQRPLLASIQGLQDAVHRFVVEETAARAALVRQRSGLFGVLAVMGLVMAIIAPFLGVIT